MKAVVYTKKGTPVPLIVLDVEKPSPKDEEILIKIYATSVNAADYRLIRMGLGIPASGIFGADIAGIVEAVGSNVTQYKPGDEVVADTSDNGSGGWAEYAAIPVQCAVPKPANVSFAEAAAIPLAGITALKALRDTGDIQPGQKVLINGAGGGVGTFAVQLAKYYGAEVTAVCSAANADMVRSIGADHVIDYALEDFTRSGVQYDRIIAVNGYHPLSAYKRSLTPTGIYVMVGGTFPQIFKSIFFGPWMSMGGRKMRVQNAKSNARDLAFLMELFAEGKIHPVIDRKYPLSETPEAYRYVNEGHVRGKVVIVVKE
jgi:NADPH:quinone reductase-like Zn-dependent oxidoreductase